MTCALGPDPAVSDRAPAAGQVPEQDPEQGAAETSGPEIPGQDPELSDPASQDRWAPGQVETARVLAAAEWSRAPLNTAVASDGNSRLRAVASEQQGSAAIQARQWW